MIEIYSFANMPMGFGEYHCGSKLFSLTWFAKERYTLGKGARGMILEPLNENRIDRIRRTLEKQFHTPISDAEIAKAMPGMVYRRAAVIELTKLNGTVYVLNADLIETLESTPDTVISLVTGRKYIVRESLDEVRKKCISYKREIYTGRE